MHAKEFAQAMAAFDPFEAKPRLAVAVSGGADSLALTLLADRWAKARGGEVLALTVDHGLRDAAAGEARQVAKWLRARQVPHRVLRWQGRKPKTGIQAAARDVRYGLLMERCGKEGILHLLLAHHREDHGPICGCFVRCLRCQRPVFGKAWRHSDKPGSRTHRTKIAPLPGCGFAKCCPPWPAKG